MYALAMTPSFDVYTLGFSNRTWEDTVHILTSHGIECVLDIRTLPGSRRTPQFNLEQLERALPQVGIRYEHMKALGGLRKPAKDSPTNAAWQNDGFRGYADYMQTPAFTQALETLIERIKESRSAYACTEAVFWRCHRQLVSDALVLRGWRVGHILSATKVQAHTLTPFAKVEDTRITYPALL